MKEILNKLRAFIVSEPKAVEPLSQQDLGLIKKCLDKEPLQTKLIGRPSHIIQARKK